MAICLAHLPLQALVLHVLPHLHLLLVHDEVIDDVAGHDAAHLPLQTLVHHVLPHLHLLLVHFHTLFCGYQMSIFVFVSNYLAETLIMFILSGVRTECCCLMWMMWWRLKILLLAVGWKPETQFV